MTDHLRSHCVKHRRQSGADAVGDPVGAKRFAERAQFVTGGERDDPRPTRDIDPVGPRPSRRDQRAGGQPNAGRHDDLTSAEIAAPCPHEAGRAGGVDDRHPVAVERDIFLDHHLVRARGQGRASEDPHRLSNPDRTIEPRPRGRRADHVEHAPNPRLISANGIAIHHRHVGSRAVEGCDHRRRKHSARRPDQRNLLRRQRHGRATDNLQRLVQGDRRHPADMHAASAKQDDLLDHHRAWLQGPCLLVEDGDRISAGEVSLPDCARPCCANLR